MKTVAQSMLHLEMFAGAAQGPLTDRQNPPFMRRADLQDPTAFLDACQDGDRLRRPFSPAPQRPYRNYFSGWQPLAAYLRRAPTWAACAPPLPILGKTQAAEAASTFEPRRPG